MTQYLQTKGRVETQGGFPNFEFQKEIFTEYETSTVIVTIADFRDFKESSPLLQGFSKQEIDLIRSTARGYQSFAARYAAKKAAELLTEIPWQYFEVYRKKDHPPQLLLRSQALEQADTIYKTNESSTTVKLPHTLPVAKQFHLSLTHDDPFAAAYQLFSKAVSIFYF